MIRLIFIWRKSSFYKRRGINILKLLSTNNSIYSYICKRLVHCFHKQIFILFSLKVLIQFFILNSIYVWLIRYGKRLNMICDIHHIRLYWWLESTLGFLIFDRLMALVTSLIPLYFESHKFVSQLYFIYFCIYHIFSTFLFAFVWKRNIAI